MGLHGFSRRRELLRSGKSNKNCSSRPVLRPRETYATHMSPHLLTAASTREVAAFCGIETPQGPGQERRERWHRLCVPSRNELFSLGTFRAPLGGRPLRRPKKSCYRGLSGWTRPVQSTFPPGCPTTTKGSTPTLPCLGQPARIARYCTGTDSRPAALNTQARQACGQQWPALK